jgi:8-oxo-dGTP pyrophosphatase MutT (NUDIX family)
MSMSDYMRELRRAVGARLIEVPAVAVIVRDAAGRVLLVRHAEGNVWVTPGGAIEPLETPADAAVRETWEETGIEAGLTRIIGVYGGPEFAVTYANGDRTSYLMVAFEAAVRGGAERPDGDEVLELGWFTREELAALPLSSWMREILADVFQPGTDARFRAAAWRPSS